MKLEFKKISKANLALFGALISRSLGFLSTIIILYLFGAEKYSQYVYTMALFSIIVIPLSEVLGHSITENYPNIPFNDKNYSRLIIVICIIYALFEYDHITTISFENISNHVLMISLCFLGINFFQKKHILKMQLDIKKQVFIYDIFVPIVIPLTFIVYFFFDVDFIRAVYSTLIVAFLAGTLTLQNIAPKESISVKIGYSHLLQYLVITFSSGQIQNVTLLMMADRLTAIEFSILAMTLKFSSLVMIPNIIQTQIVIPRVKKLINEKNILHLSFVLNSMRTKAVLLATASVPIIMIICTVTLSSTIINLQLTTILLILCICLSQVFLVWIGPVATFYIACRDTLLPTAVNAARIVFVALALNYCSTVNSALIIIVVATIVFGLTLILLKQTKLKTIETKGVHDAV